MWPDTGMVWIPGTVQYLIFVLSTILEYRAPCTQVLVYSSYIMYWLSSLQYVQYLVVYGNTSCRYRYCASTSTTTLECNVIHVVLVRTSTGIPVTYCHVQHWIQSTCTCKHCNQHCSSSSYCTSQLRISNGMNASITPSVIMAASTWARSREIGARCQYQYCSTS